MYNDYYYKACLFVMCKAGSVELVDQELQCHVAAAALIDDSSLEGNR